MCGVQLCVYAAGGCVLYVCGDVLQAYVRASMCVQCVCVGCVYVRVYVCMYRREMEKRGCYYC